MKKIIKLSVAAALAATAMNAAVVDNVKVSGNAKLWYETNDAGQNSYFDQASSSGQVVVNLKASADVGMVKVNLGNTTATTAALEKQIVSTSRSGGSTDGETIETQNFMSIANLSTTIGGTTLIVGKQTLNTPFVFTEAWNATANTFDAGVLVNKGLIPGVTIVLADVKSGNGHKAGDVVSTTDAYKNNGSTTYNGEFNAIDGTFVQASASIAGVATNASITELAGDTYSWIDGTTTIAGAKVTATYAEIDPATTLGTTITDADTTSAVAVKVSTKIAGLNVMAAYSDVSDDNTQANFANLATGGKKTKLPTAGVYTDGVYVSQPDSEAFKIKVSGIKVGPVALAAQYVDCSNDTTVSKNTQEFDVFATTKVAGIATKVIYMHRAFDEAGEANQDKIRVIASYSF